MKFSIREKLTMWLLWATWRIAPRPHKKYVAMAIFEIAQNMADEK